MHRIVVQRSQRTSAVSPPQLLGMLQALDMAIGTVPRKMELVASHTFDPHMTCWTQIQAICEAQLKIRCKLAASESNAQACANKAWIHQQTAWVIWRIC